MIGAVEDEEQAGHTSDHSDNLWSPCTLLCPSIQIINPEYSQ